ncbi:MAG: diguanylate cyclase [Lachnospiraceae bacterium]|nr:diguanylate cyclase [Lachnospiraceae bacterium]
MKRLLIVDDDNMNCVMAEYALSKDYEVFAVNSGSAALYFLENEPVDLILMDIEMPEMSGKEVASKIKENPIWSKIPIIFLTADSDPKTEAECLSWGADDFITKPFVPLVMNTRVSRILEVYELRKDLEKQLEKRTKQAEVATLKSQTDALTKLYNRDYLELRLNEFLGDGGVGTLFMMDLDDFKTMNDTYGHIMGDKTLQYFAAVLKEYAREEDIVCRLAGDEFVTFYTGLKDRDVAAKKAEGIIKTFSEKMEELGYGGIVSVSVGIMMAQENDEYQELYNNADKALYCVKNNGKNAYHFYDENNDTITEVSTVMDLEYVSNMMEKGLSEKRGVFHLAYDEFKNVYDFISRCVARKKQKVQLVLFTMNMRNKDVDTSIEDVMQLWEESLICSLRSVDTGTRYSSSQYIVIFMDADLENGKAVAERVINRFYDENIGMRDIVRVAYDIRTMEPKV